MKSNYLLKSISTLLTTLLTVGLLEISAAQAVTLTMDEETFSKNNSIVATETFDNLGPKIFQGTSVTLNAITYSDPLTPEWRIFQNAQGNNLSFALVSNATTPKKSVSFGANQGVKAFSFELTPFTSDPEWGDSEFKFIVEELDGTSTILSSRPKGSNNQFFGFSSELGIKSLTIAPQITQGGLLTNFALDNISRSELIQISENDPPQSVPEPASGLALLGLTVGGIVRRKQSP